MNIQPLRQIFVLFEAFFFSVFMSGCSGGSQNQPVIVVHSDHVISGEVISIVVPLKSPEQLPWTITNFRVSCGCMAITASDGSRLKFPIALSGGRELPVVASVDTTGKVGKNKVSILFEGLSNGKAVEQTYELHLDVAAAWDSDPSIVVFNDLRKGETAEAEVLLFSAGGDRLSIESCDVSDSSRIKLKISEGTGETRTVASAFGSHDFVCCNRLRIDYVAGATDHDYVVLRGLAGRVRHEIQIQRDLTVDQSLQVEPPIVPFNSSDSLTKVAWVTVPKHMGTPKIESEFHWLSAELIPQTSAVGADSALFRLDLKLTPQNLESLERGDYEIPIICGANSTKLIIRINANQG